MTFFSNIVIAALCFAIAGCSDDKPISNTAQAESTPNEVEIVTFHVEILRSHLEEGKTIATRNTEKLEKAYKSGNLNAWNKAVKAYKDEAVHFQDKVSKIFGSQLENEEANGALDDAHHHLSTIAAALVEVPRSLTFAASPEAAQQEIRAAALEGVDARLKFEEAIAKAYKIHGATEKPNP